MEFFDPNKPVSLSEELHLETRNSAAGKHIASGYQTHYSKHVRSIVRDPASSKATAGESSGQALSLPQPLAVASSLSGVVESRVSTRTYGAAPLTSQELATILYLANGTHGGRRTVPCSGGLWSIELFPIVLNVDAIEPGVYHYHSPGHQLLTVRKGHYGSWLEHCVLFQPEFAKASVVIALACCFKRLKSKYGERAYRLGYIDAGHVSSNVYLGATGLELPVCATAGFIDDELDSFLKLDGLDWSSILTVAIGSRA